MKKCPYCENEIEDNTECKYCKEFLEEKELKRKIGVVILIPFFLLILSSLFAFYKGNKAFYRFSFCISCSILGLSLRAFYYIPLFKNKPKKITKEKPYKKLDKDETKITYLYYCIMLIMISCLLWLINYSTIISLIPSVFYVLSILLFFNLGVAVLTAIDRFKL